MPPVDPNPSNRQEPDEFERLLNSFQPGAPAEKLSPDMERTMRVAVPKEVERLTGPPGSSGGTQNVPAMRQEERIPLPMPPTPAARAADHSETMAIRIPDLAPEPAPARPAPVVQMPPPPTASPVMAPPPQPQAAPVSYQASAQPQAAPKVSQGQQLLLIALLAFAVVLLIVLSAILYFDIGVSTAR